MKYPLIGITCSTHPTEEKYYLVKDYVDAIDACGGIPLLIPPIDSREKMTDVLEKLQGLLLSGGKDLDPQYYGEEPTGVWRIDPGKDVLDLELARIALERDMPILGICRGCQVLNVVAGGTLIQHLSTADGKLKHWQRAPDGYPTHRMDVTPGTRLREIVGRDSIRVNSFHHQSIKDIGKGYQVSGVAADGTVEAIESTSKRWVLAVQFHIEYMWQAYPEMKKIFTHFIEASSKA